mmetsp:Transcript_10571/g.35039  ORF Transcript_10571/g.35039 Transcript_10571/m.35039 type:complete len:510 (-) Transcript_10571:50-1579(-)
MASSSTLGLTPPKWARTLLSQTTSAFGRRPSATTLDYPEAAEQKEAEEHEGAVVLGARRSKDRDSPAELLYGDNGTGDDSSASSALESVRRRLCTREGWVEIVGFVAWMALICLHVGQLFGLWWFFWQHVARHDCCGDDDRGARHQPTVKLALTGAAAATAAAKGSSALAGTLARRAALQHVARNRARRAAAFAVWSGWLGTAAALERPLLRRCMPPVVFTLLYHAELFGLSGLAMTLCTNFASYLHQPGKRLFDVGFALVPELRRHSWLAPVSDALTGLMPVATFIYLTLFLDRRRRCRAVTDWFRMMTVVYCFRCITSTMTSLPGPAPHCGSRSYKAGTYRPPDSWHDIATSLSTAISGGSCGDLLFSGHAAMTTITTLLLVRQQRRHGGHCEQRAKVAGCCYIATVCVFALASRKHYSVDLALGTLIGSLTYFRFRDSWSRDPVSLDRMEQLSRYYAPHGADYAPQHDRSDRDDRSDRHACRRCDFDGVTASVPLLDDDKPVARLV